MSRRWSKSAPLEALSCKSALHNSLSRSLSQLAHSAFLVCDRIGRIWATRQLCILWIIGIAIFMASNGHLGAIYAGRFIAGLGVGQTPVVGPVYIAEVTPASIRGLCTCLFTGFVYLGIVLAYFTNYGCQVNMGDSTAARWQVPTSLHIIFAGLIFLLTLAQSESPRYLIMKGRYEKAAQAMARLRNLPQHHEYVASELEHITAAYREEATATANTGRLGILKEAFANPSNLYRVSLTIAAQILSQWSGAGSITLYAPDLFHLLGIPDTNTALLVTAVFGIVKLVAAVGCALFLVDVIGRKRSLLLGITCQAVAMVYVAGFLTAVPQLGGHNTAESLTGPQLAASKGAVAMIYLSGFGWALGWNSMVRPVSSEYGAMTELTMGLAILTHGGVVPAADSRLLHVAGHDDPLCEPVWKLQGRSGSAAARCRRRHLPAGYLLVLRGCDDFGWSVGVVRHAGNGG